MTWNSVTTDRASFTITQASIDTVTLNEPTELFYNAKEQSVTLKEVKANGVTLTADQYEATGLSAEGDPVNDTWIDVTVTAKSGGNFTGSKTVANAWVIKGHTHDFTCAVSEGKFTVTCKNSSTCTIPGGTSLEIVCENAGKVYDGTPLTATVKDNTTGSYTFGTYTQGGTYTDITWDDSSANAGNHTATFKATVGGTQYTIFKTFTIAPLDISGATFELDNTAFDYTDASRTVNVKTLTANGLTVNDYDKSGVWTAQYVGTYEATVTGKGNFCGSKSTTWTIKTPTKAITGASAADPDKGYGTVIDNKLTVSDTTKLVWKGNNTWSAGITLTWPIDVRHNKDWDFTQGWDYTDVAHVRTQLSTTDKVYTGTQIQAGETDGEDLTLATGTKTYKKVKLGSEYSCTYVKTTTWNVKFTLKQVTDAIEASKTHLTYQMTAFAPLWTEDEYLGNNYGVAPATYTIEVPLAGIVLNDGDGNQVYPALPYVAQVDGKKKYLTLDAALKAASSGQTVNAIAACEAGTFTVGKNVTLNLGGNGASSGATYKLDADDGNMQAKVVSSKAEDVTTVDPDLFAVSASGYTYTVVHAHIHDWSPTLDGPKLTVDCVNTATACDVGSTYVELVVTKAGSDGIAPELAVANKDTFLGIVNKYATIASVGSISIVRTTDDGAAYTKWYVGDYRATCVVTLNDTAHTLTKDFSIAKPEGGYTSGWEVGSTGIRYLEEDLSIVYATAKDGDTIYYRDTSRDFETHDFSVGNKNLTFDFNGKTLSNDQNKLMTLKNTGSGTLTFQNVVIQQPKDSFVSNQIQTDGKIVFGDGVKAVNQADNKSRYLTITVNSGSLIVSNGLYQCGFTTANNATVLLEAGKYWEYDPPALGQYDLADRVCREITEVIGGVTYKYEIVEHVHVFAYTAEGVVITCKCEGMDKEACYWYQNPQTATLTANDADESSEPYAGASVSYDIGFIDQTQPITYWQGDEQLSGAPTRFGTYTAKLTVGGATAAKSFTIRPMKVSITVPDAVHGKVTQVLDGDTPVTSETSTYSVTHGNKITATYAADNGYEPATLTATLDCAEPGDTVTPPTFTAIKYPISYELNGGTNHDDNPPTYTIEDAVELKPATKRGYTFTGWDPAGVIAKGSMGERTFAATWTPTVYKVEYVMSNGTNHADNPATYTVEQSVALKNPTRKGYEFTGWSPTNGIAPGSIDNRTFYATWTATVYTVEFRDAVTEETKAETMTYTIETASPLKLRDLPEQPNYTANGWLTNRLDVTGQAKTGELDISADMLGDKTFYVHFVFQTPVDPEKPDAPQVVIPQVVVTNIVEDAETKTAEQINEELNTPSNGVTKVERYVLGLDMKDMNDVPVIQPEQTADATKVRVNVANIAPLPSNVVNAEVRYSIETSSTPDFAHPEAGAKQDSPTFDLPLPASGVLYYRAKIDLVKPE